MEKILALILYNQALIMTELANNLEDRPEKEIEEAFATLLTASNAASEVADKLGE